MNRSDEIVEEVRAARDAYAARFDFDLKRIFADLQKEEKLDPAPRATLAPRTPHERGSANNETRSH